MGKFLCSTLTFVAAAALSGCGTICNTWSCCSSGPHRVYGGVLLDAQAFVETFQAKDPEKQVEWSLLNAGTAVLEGCFLAIDLPLSAVADTLTLPITIPTAIEKISAKEERGNPTHAQNENKPLATNY